MKNHTCTVYVFDKSKCHYMYKYDVDFTYKKKKTPRIFAIPDENSSGWQISWYTHNLKFGKTFWTPSTYLIWGKRRSRPNRLRLSKPRGWQDASK